MFLRYIVSNYKSIGHPIEFCMLPVQATMDERFLKSIPTKNGDWEVLRRGGFLGRMLPANLLLLNRLLLPAILLLMVKKADRASELTSSEENSKNEKESLHFSLFFI